jgi:glycosyltransferase involved in cell wall biosynthesis
LSTPDVLGRRAQHFARARGIPIVTSLHTRFETYLEYYGLRILEGWITRYLRRFYGDSDRILVPNELIAEEMRAAGIERPLAIWGRGVDRTIFTPDRRDPAWRRALGYGDDDVIVLFFGRLVREKGLDMFCQVMETARAMGHHLRPLIVGDGPAKDAFASRLPDANFLGHLSGADLGRAVASADILLNPSVTEAFGNVTLEAMAAGVAILSADVPSAQALVQHGRTGILVRADRSESYARGLDQLIRRPEFRMSLIQAALVEASRYEWNDILSDVVSVYRDCLRSRLARPSA